MVDPEKAFRAVEVGKDADLAEGFKALEAIGWNFQERSMKILAKSLQLVPGFSCFHLGDYVIEDVHCTGLCNLI